MGIFPPQVEINSFETEDEIIEACYTKFKECVLNKGARAKLFDRDVFIPIEPWIERKAQMFWHLASMSLKEKVSVFPCNNDVVISKCNENCIYHKRQITLSNGDLRDICYYRATKAFWVQQIILYANKEDACVKLWTKRDNKKKRNELYLRYQYLHIDYIAVFEDKPNGKYVLLSAYPVFYINSKNGFNKDYQNYLKEKRI